MSDELSTYNQALAITKSDTVNFDASVSTSGQNVKPCDAMWIGTGGVVVAVLQNGATASFTCADGSLLPIRAIRVNSGSTTAALMYALYAV